MTRKTLILLISWMTITSAAYGSNKTASNAAISIDMGITEDSHTSEDTHGTKSSPLLPAAEPKTPHKANHTPQMEELPHIHKYHKERVKKVKKHHNKYWIISQVLIIICHLSMLLIAYLHVTH